MIPGWLPVLILLIPLFTAVVVGRFPWSGAALAHRFAALAMAVATALAAWMAVMSVRSGTAWQGPHVTWVDLGSCTLGAGVYVDPMGAVMALIVCLLAVLVLVFNEWYMHDDAQSARFPWQFCFFVAAMLGVVLSDNLFLSFCCWELVGLGSYLLIGFWFDKPAASDDPDYQAKKGRNAQGVIERELSPAHAQLKAFVMNRVGDLGFLIGIGALLAATLQAGRTGDVLSFGSLLGFQATGTGSFLGLSGQSLMVLAALGIFCGAVGKSAQFPLHPWLPDAMQGPTTASSMIHAATMVAAGVFLVARCYPLFPQEALDVVGWIGAITCFIAATIACVQWDLKAVLAYSTVSQLGLMFVGLGAGADAGGRAAGMAHLFTHAMFKCLLFLCAGAVIHACAGHQDLHRMGGLRKRMPVTAYASLAAVLAICGAPLFSGFYSKDSVLAAALIHAQHHGGAAWGPLVLACAGSLLTAAYMLRWWFQLFMGGERDHDVTHHAHDPASGAKVVLLVLAPFTLAIPWTLNGWLDHAIGTALAKGVQALGAEHGGAHESAHGTAMVIALVLFAVGGGMALLLYGRGSAPAERLATALSPLHRFCSRLWGIDKLENLLFVRWFGRGLGSLTARLDLGSPERLRELESGRPGRLQDASSLDGLVDGIGHTCASLGRTGSLLHAGRLGAYLAFTSVLGAIGLLWVLLR